MGQYSIGAGTAQSGGGYAGIVGQPGQTTEAKRGVVIRDKTGRTLSDLEARGWDRSTQGELTAAWEEDAPEPMAEAAEAPVAPVETPTTITPGTPTPPPNAAPAMMGLQSAMRNDAGWADEGAMSENAMGLGSRTPPAAVTTLSQIMRRFGRTY